MMECLTLVEVKYTIAHIYTVEKISKMSFFLTNKHKIYRLRNFILLIDMFSKLLNRV